MPDNLPKRFSIWWGPPKEFVTTSAERRVSWLELFYDLVYVIAIARITEVFAHHVSVQGFIESVAMFTLVYWGWLNGSLYHDLHGNQGLRTRLMTLWQMIIIGALAVALDKEHKSFTEITVIFMAMQLFITYQWWSVGFYDKGHRRYNKPYSILFLVAFALMGISLWVPYSWLMVIFPLVLLCNYIPPFIANQLLRRESLSYDLSSSMFERLGLFTIIIFGEVALGVVHGIGKLPEHHALDWINFTLGFAIVFALWWLFFTFISNRAVRSGFDKASLLELLYIPALIALCCIAVSLSGFFVENTFTHNLQQLFGIAVGAFIICIVLMMYLLTYHEIFDGLLRRMRRSMLVTSVFFLICSCVPFFGSVTVYLALVLLVLGIEIAYLNYVYYNELLRVGLDPTEVIVMSDE